MNKLAKKIKDLRLGLGLRQHELASKIGSNQASVSKWENGKDSPDRENLVKLANLAGQSVNEFLGLAESHQVGGRRISVVGEIAAGSWVEAIEWPETDRYDVAVSLPSEYSDVPLQGFVVRGDSMDKMYPDGSIVYVAPLKYIGGIISNGDVVMVMRQDTSGLVEGTLKEYSIDDAGRAWLWPRSNSPEHQAPITYIKGKRNDVDNVTVTGVVVAALVFSKRQHKK